MKKAFTILLMMLMASAALIQAQVLEDFETHATIDGGAWGGYEGYYIERTSIDLSLFGRIRLAGNFHLEGRVGYALSRSYNQYSADQTVPFRIAIIKFNDERVAKNTLFDPGAIVNLRLVYNLPL